MIKPPFVVANLFDVAPCALVLRTLLGKDEATFFVFFLKNKGFDLITKRHDLVGVDVIANTEFA